MLLNFWATWSEACRIELPKLESLQQSRGKDIDIAAIAEDGGGSFVVAPFLRKLGIKHLPVYLDPDGVAVATASATRHASPFVLFSTPMSYVISRQGLIVGYIAGPVDWTGESAVTLIEYIAQAT